MSRSDAQRVLGVSVEVMDISHVRDADMRPTKACLIGTRVSTLEFISD
jgi:hypothetical protein